MADFTQDLAETIRAGDTSTKRTTKLVSNSLIVSDAPRNLHGITLSERIKLLDYPRGLPNTYLSARAKWVTFEGTYQALVNYLDAQGTPEHKVKGFAFTSAGRALVTVHKH